MSTVGRVSTQGYEHSVEFSLIFKPDNVLAPSAIPWNEDHAKPREMTLDDIKDFKAAFKASVLRALTCGFDVIEIHRYALTRVGPM